MIARALRRRNRSRNVLSCLAAGFLAAGASPPAASPALPQRHLVTIRGMAFQPAVLEAAPGDTIVWINRDLVPHTATVEGSNGWDTGILATGDSARYVPLRPGAWAYGCRLHPTMQARLLVTREPGPRTPAAVHRAY